MRILIVTHAPLSPEFGAGQMAINLAGAFRKQGQEVVLWSPHSLGSKTKWWQSTQQIRSKLNAFVQNQAPFDLIDSHALFITKELSRSSVVVARSVQPDLLYLAHSSNFSLNRNFKSILKAYAHNFYNIYQALMILQGWNRAKHILCLGNLELCWMKKWFPWWKNKLSCYVNALSLEDQKNLARIRQQRKRLTATNLKFLWIGRWVNHKGTDTLINFIQDWVKIRENDTFTIAGCGSDISKEFPKELRESGKLKIIPSFKRSRLDDLLINHDLGLFTSKVEGWGLVLNEMLESGMPVFATSAGGVEDLKQFLSCKLQDFPPFPSSILNVINTTVDNTVNMKIYYETFTWEKIVKVYTNSILNKIDSHKTKASEKNYIS